MEKEGGKGLEESVEKKGRAVCAKKRKGRGKSQMGASGSEWTADMEMKR